MNGILRKQYQTKQPTVPQEKVFQGLNDLDPQVHFFQLSVNLRLIPYLQQQVKNFQAGQISHNYEKWAVLTSDHNILQLVKESLIDFINDPPVQSSYPHSSVNRDHLEAVSLEIKPLRTKKVIIPSIHEPGEFILHIFSVPKPYDKIHLILNLKNFNESAANIHFKMDNIKTVVKLITKNCWIAPIDLKDAYYRVRMDPLYQKYLKFSFGNDLSIHCVSK